MDKFVSFVRKACESPEIPGLRESWWLSDRVENPSRPGAGETSSDHRGLQLADAVEAWMIANDFTHVNFVGHSQGGMDLRKAAKILHDRFGYQVVKVAYSISSPPPVQTSAPASASGSSSTEPATDPTPSAPVDYQPLLEGATLMTGTLSFEQVVALMQQHHGDSLDSRLGQIDLITALLDYLRQSQPEDWRLVMQGLLEAAFPARAAELMQLAENHLEYQAWYAAGAADIRQLDPDTRMEVLMEHQAAIFGKEVAEELWQHQIRDYQMAKAMDRITADTERPLNARLEELTELVRDTYPQAAIDNQSMAMGDSFANKFMAASQADLRAMPVHQRRETIANIRCSLGYSERAVENLARLDRKRDQRWQAGDQYMAQRQEITANYEGEERERRLAEARRSLLGAEADSIRKEEGAGYFRYQQERSYGIH